MRKTAGFTLTEILVAVALLVAVTLAAAEFQRNVFFWNKGIQGSLNAQLSARAVLREFTSESREATASILGAYPIAEAATSSFAFYGDIDDDGRPERVRYYVQGKQLKKGVVTPSGSPLSYNLATERTSTVIGDVVNGPAPVFHYYDAAYDGTTAPLSSPFSISSVRLVRMTLLIDGDPGRAPDAMVFTTQVTVRNLKDNL